ncbi:hypothetical protein SDC9_206135 [bioreactor metagenome]|uniref:Uncharacterized protein n=1 Tax=bioreactor metagenome TaxID=1076179 RepID=A0A645J5L3_9ZZZZ
MFGSHAGSDHVRNPAGDDLGLAGSGTGEHQQRAFNGDHRLALFRIEAGEQFVDRGHQAFRTANSIPEAPNMAQAAVTGLVNCSNTPPEMM